MSKHWVKFVAKKQVKEAVDVAFNTDKGRVAFEAHKKVTKPVPVKFKAEDKKK